MSDSYIQLLAQLSRPLDHDQNLLHIFTAALAGKFEGEEAPIRSVIMLSNKLGVIWARGIAVSEYLVSKSFDLGNSLLVDFEFPRSQPSFLVEIVPRKKNQAIDGKRFDKMFEDLKTTVGHMECVLKSEYRIVVKFSSPEDAVKYCPSFVDPMKVDGHLTITSRTILIKEHVVMRAAYVGGSQPFLKMENSLKSSESMADFVNSKFSYFKDRPVILSVLCPFTTAGNVPDSKNQYTDEVNIACATHYDYRLLRNSPPVVFPGANGSGGSLILRSVADQKEKEKSKKGTDEEGEEEVTSNSSSSEKAAGEVVAGGESQSGKSVPIGQAYVFWDYGSCPVDDEMCAPQDIEPHTVGAVTANIRGVIDRYAQYRKDIGVPIKMNSGITKNVVAPQGTSFRNIDKIPLTWGSFTKHEYKVHHYSKKMSSDGLIMGVVEAILRNRRRENFQPVFCFVTNDPEILKVISHLKSENQHEILLIHNTMTANVCNAVKKHYNWIQVQDIPKNKVKGKDTKKADDKNKEASKKAAEKEVSKDKKGQQQDKSTTSSLRTAAASEKVDEYTSMVFPPEKELVPWMPTGEFYTMGIEDDPELRKKGKKDEKATPTNASGGKRDQDNSDDEDDSGGKDSGGARQLKCDLRFSSVATYMKRLLIWRRQQDDADGVDPHNYLFGEDTTGYDENPALICFVRIELNPKVKKFYMFLKGPAGPQLDLRFQRLKAMVDEILKVRQLYNFSGWHAEHRQALIGSDALMAHERMTRAVVLFHYNGATTVAEIVALKQVQLNALLRFVQRLSPKTMTIEVPAAFVSWYDDNQWDRMRNCFAVKVEVQDPQGLLKKSKSGFISPEDADKMLKLKVFGFQPKFIDAAVEHIQLNDDRKELVVMTLTESEVGPVGGGGKQQGKETFNKAIDSLKEASKATASSAVVTSADGPACVSSRTAASLGPPPGMGDAAPSRDTSSSGASTPSLSGEVTVTVGEGGTTVHRAVYIFADREAGLFFFAFEKPLREFLTKNFGVYLDEGELQNQIKLMNQGGDAIKNVTLKVVLCSNVLKNVQEARAYMDNFSTNALGRFQIFFPRVSARKIKEIFNKKSILSSKVTGTRANYMSTVLGGEDSVADPLKVPGYVNIRTKPPVNQQSKLTFPLDVTVTICGSLFMPETRAVLEQCKISFNSIPSEYSTSSVVIPADHHMKQQLTVKTEREELVKKFQLVALRWEEGTRATGNVSTVKIWAYTKAGLKNILTEILRSDMGGGVATIVIEEKEMENENVALMFGPTHTVPPSAVTAGLGHGMMEATDEFGRIPMSSSQQQQQQLMPPVPIDIGGGIGGGGEWAPRGSGGMGTPENIPPHLLHGGPRGGYPSPANGGYSSYPPGVHLGGKGSYPPGNVGPGGLKGVSPLPPKAFLPPPIPEPAVTIPHARTVVYLPDLSLRYIMQGEPLKSKLNEVLQRIDSQEGIRIVYPYKDRTDPHAAFEIDGDGDIVPPATAELNEFLEKAHRSIRCVQVILNMEQYNYLTAGGEGISTGVNMSVNDIQNQFGVHLLFNPQAVAAKDAFSLFDFRFASEFVKRNEDDFLKDSGAQDMLGGVGAASGLSELKNTDKEMISVSVFNVHSRRSVEIAIISSNSSESGWTWGVNNLLLLVGSNTLGFNPSEVDLLNRGEVLVHNDRMTGKTILRIKPNSTTRGINFQAAVLTNALLKCLQKANELGLKGLAVSAPTDIDAFPELTPDLVRSLTVEAVVEFAKKCRSYLRFTRLVCIELGYNVATVQSIQDRANPPNPNVPAALVALERRIEPAQRDRMVRTITVLLERQETELLEEVAQQNAYRNGHFPYGQPPPPQPEPRSKLAVSACNVPLPNTLFPVIVNMERQRGVKTFLVKGLLSGVVKAVDQIKVRLAAPSTKHLSNPLAMEGFY